MTVCVFDVNETLLDLAGLDRIFDRIFGDPAARAEWFGQMLQSAFAAAAAGRYLRFGDAGAGALRMLAERRGVELAPGDERELGVGMRSLPPHPEVPAALDSLRDAGFRLTALTNSTLEVARDQISHAGLAARFERVLSADEVRRLKPAPEPYRLAADRMGVEIQDVRLVAAHAWDVAGALRAGARAAFVARPGMVLDPTGEAPDIVGRDLGEVSAAIVAADTP